MKNTDIISSNLLYDFDYNEISNYFGQNMSKNFLQVFLIKLKDFVTENDSGRIFENYIEMRMCIKDIFGNEYISFIDKTLWDDNERGMTYESHMKSKEEQLLKESNSSKKLGTIINLYFSNSNKNKSSPLLAAGIKKCIEDFEYSTTVEDKIIKLVFSEGVLYLYGPSKEEERKVVIRIYTPERDPIVLRGQNRKYLNQGWDVSDIEVVSKIDLDFSGEDDD